MIYQKEQENKSVIEVSIKKEDKPVVFDIQIEITEQNMLKFETPFFNSEFEVKVITKTALKTELNSMLDQISDHFYQVRRLSSVTTEEEGKIIDCKQIIDVFEKVKLF